MTTVTDIFAGCLRARTSLGGRAPRRYCADLRSVTQPHQALARASSWMQALRRGLPALTPASDYGALLGALADALLQPQERAMPGTARRAPRRGVSDDSERRSRAETRAPAGRNGSGNARNFTGLGRFDRIGGASAADSAGARRGRSAAIVGLRKAQRASAASSPGVVSRLTDPSGMQGAAVATGQMGTLDELLSEAAVRDWQNRLVRRAITRLRSAAAESGISYLYSNGPPASRAEEVTQRTDLHWLHESWSSLVEGQSATADVLSWAVNLQRDLPLEQAGVPQPEFGARRPDMQPTTSAAQTPGRAQPKASQPKLVSVAGWSELSNDGFPDSVPGADALAGQRNAAEPWLQTATTAARELAEELLSRAHDEIRVPSPVASMRTSASQKPRPTPATSDTRTEMPLLHRQELDAPEDLSAFAGKMKRVLDEEARRYGIDV
ncbi:MAG TPA: hypothetical protein VFQ24_16695 [Terriglobia bacterium]|nr:hypothetical protein [Terriglobia bacterium]